MEIVRVEKAEAGWFIKPFSYGSKFGAFKKESDAKLAADAINMAFHAGRSSLAADMRDLLCVDEAD